MRRIPLSIEVKKVLKLLMGTLCSMLVVVGVYYFMKATDTAEKGYQLKETQLRRERLESENRILQQQVLDAQSLRKLESGMAASGMTVPEKPTYLEPLGPLSKKNSQTMESFF